MLQQTRVEAVIPYYARFLSRFPDVAALARASEDEVLALWSGLGYYSRGRNLHKAARLVAAEGEPRAYDAIRRLPGVGPYTAAAIASISLGLPHAAVDGNVLRVVSRLTGDASDIGSAGTRRAFGETARTLLDPARPGDFNQAMMELGATVCVPAAPRCAACPVARFCEALAAGTERDLPVKPQKAAVRRTTLDLALTVRDERVLLVRRDAAESRLAGFWELPDRPERGRRGAPGAQFSHQIVNDRYLVRVWPAKSGAIPPESRWIPLAELGDIPLSTIARKALRTCGILPQKAREE